MCHHDRHITRVLFHCEHSASPSQVTTNSTTISTTVHCFGWCVRSRTRRNTQHAHLVPAFPSSSAVDARIPSTARDIARTLRATSKLTVRLRKLTQRKGLFDDPTAEVATRTLSSNSLCADFHNLSLLPPLVPPQINEITTVLKKNVKHLQAKLTALMKVINATCKSRTV